MNILISILCLSLIATSGNKPETRGWVGIEVDNLTTAMRTALNTDFGVLVTFISHDSPAEKSGIEVGDVILDFDGEKIYERDDLEYLIKRNPNKKVTILVLRKGEKKKLNVKIGAMEYEEYWLKIPPIRFPEDLERALRNLKPKWEEEMEHLKREIDRLEKQIDSLKKEIERKSKI